MESVILLVVVLAIVYLCTGAMGLGSIAALALVGGLREFAHAYGVNVLPDWVWCSMAGAAVLAVWVSLTYYLLGSK